MAYYGFRCYSREGKALGWLYTAMQERELNSTNNSENFSWCKRWKTERGAKKNFDYYDSRWQFNTKGGYLKIEIMPEVEETTNRSSQQRWDAQNQDIIKKSKVKYDQENPIWSFRPTPPILEWLEEERLMDKNLDLETNSALINRKLEKLRKLECQGH